MIEKPTEHWYERAADAIVREGKTLFWFSNDANLGLTQKECESILRSKGFQNVLRTQRNLYHRELVQDPTYTRATVEGQLVYAIQKLLDNGAFDKAATAIMQLAKLKGWTTDQASVNVFSDLNANSIDLLRKKIQEKMTGKPVN